MTKDIYIVMDYLESDLKVTINHGIFDSKSIKSNMFSLLLGIYTLHNSNVIHKELKPMNVLIDKNEGLRLINYGLNYSITESEWYTNSKTSLNDSKNYKSPELIMGYEKVGKPMDIWALGCIFGEILQKENRKPLFLSDNCKNIFITI